MDTIDLKKIDIKEEDLSEVQIKYAKEVNSYIEFVEVLLKECIVSLDPQQISENLVKMSGYYSRIAEILPDLEYEYAKVTDDGEVTRDERWLFLNSSGAESAASCTEKAKSSFTREWRKRKRIARWLWEKVKYYYNTLERIINSVNRKYDSVCGEKRVSKFQT